MIAVMITRVAFLCIAVALYHGMSWRWPAGQRVGLGGPSGIMCTRGHGCRPIPKIALDCEGQELP